VSPRRRTHGTEPRRPRLAARARGAAGDPIGTGMRLIDVDAMREAFADRDLVEALRRGHRAGVDTVERSLISEGAGPAANHLLVPPAWRCGDVLGAKLVTVFPANPPPVPTIQTVYILFSGRDGTPLAALSGAEFTLRKTAADSALGADFLARRDMG